MNPHDLSALGSRATCGLVIAAAIGGVMYFMGQSSAKKYAKHVRRKAASERQKNLEAAKRELVQKRAAAEKQVQAVALEARRLKEQTDRIEARHPELRGGGDALDLNLLENTKVGLKTVVHNTANALFRRQNPQYTSTSIKQGKYGFMLDVRFKDRLTPASISQIERSVESLRRTVPPRWISRIVIRAKRKGSRYDMSVTLGALSRIDGLFARTAAGAALGASRRKLTAPRRIRTQRDRTRAALMIGGHAGASFSYFGPSLGRTRITSRYQTYRLLPGAYFFAVLDGTQYYGVWATLRGGNVYSSFYRRQGTRPGRSRPRRRYPTRRRR